MHRLHQDEQVHEQAMLDLDEIARQGARRMLAEALEAEVQETTSMPPAASATSRATPWW